MPGTSGDLTGDRLALRDLVDAYARHADRREPERQAEVFAPEGRVRLFRDGSPEPFDTVTGTAALVETFTRLIATYDATTYLNGQSTLDVAGDTARGETYCMAHHLLQEDGVRVLLTMALRYLDTFERGSGGWRIVQRDLVIDWTDRRPSSP